MVRFIKMFCKLAQYFLCSLHSNMVRFINIKQEDYTVRDKGLHSNMVFNESLQ